MLDVVLWKVHHSLSSQFYAKHNKKCYLNFWHKSNNNLGTEFACYKSWSTSNLCKIMASSSNMILWKKSSCSWRFDYTFLYKISVLEKALKTDGRLLGLYCLYCQILECVNNEISGQMKIFVFWKNPKICAKYVFLINYTMSIVSLTDVKVAPV